MNNPNTDSDIDVDVDIETDAYVDAGICNTARNPNIENIRTDIDIDIGTSNTAKAPNIKHTSPEVKDVCYFAERLRHMLDVKISHLRRAMQKSDTHLASDMNMIRIQALAWTRKNTGFNA
jgi:hypothetical protein